MPAPLRRSHGRPHGGRLAAFATLLLAFLLTVPAAAQVRGISYTLSPTVEYLYFDDDAGLDDQFLYGGELGFGFGRLVELNAVYTFNDNALTNYGNLSDISDELADRLGELDERGVGIQRYGGTVKLNLATGNIVPYVQAGTGLIRFDPEDRNASRTIYLAGGGGLQFSVANRYTLRVGAQNVSYRYNLGSAFFDETDLADAGLTPANFSEVTVNNWAFRGALQFYLGGRDPDQETDLDAALRDQFAGGGGVAVPIEPFYGSISFDDAFGLRETQRVAGVHAGIDLGPYVGVRGFYWRGIEEDETFKMDDLQAYGGEVKFRLGSSMSLTPYLLVGGGYLDVMDGYEGRPDAVTDAEDHPFAMGGVGAVLPLGDALRLHGSVRNLLMTTQGVDNVNDPNDVQSNWMYAAGLTFRLGASGGPSAGAVVDERFRSYADENLARQEALEEEVMRLQSRLDSLATAQRTADEPTLAERRALLRADSLRSAAAAGLSLTDAERAALRRLDAMDSTEVAMMMPREGAAMRSNLSDRTITIPIPEEGEIYLRFGDTVVDPTAGTYRVPTVLPDGTVALTTRGDTSAVGGGLTAAQIESIVADAVARQMTSGAETQEMQRLRAEIRTLRERLEVRDDELDRMLRERQGSNVTVIDRDGRVVRDVSDDAVDTGGLFGQRDLQGVYTVLGARAGRGPEQFLVGLRGDYRAYDGARLRIVPEVTLGFGGGGTSFALVGNGIAPFAEGFLGDLTPYAGIGAGLVSESGFDGLGLALNLLVGAEYPLGGSAVFGEYSTLDLFDYSRLFVGYRIGF